MRIKTKTYIGLLLISALLPMLYLFVWIQMRGLDVKITDAMIAARIKELVGETRRAEEDYLRSGSLGAEKIFRSKLSEFLEEAQKIKPSRSRALPQDWKSAGIRLGRAYETAFKEIPGLKQAITATEENLNRQGILLEKAVTQAYGQLKSAGSAPPTSSFNEKVDKITVANFILKEGYRFIPSNASSSSESVSKMRSALQELSREWHQDLLIQTASDYAASFQLFQELQGKLSDRSESLHEIFRDLEGLSSKLLGDMNQRRDESKEAVMMAILAGFAVCGCLVLFVSFWVTRILTGPIFRLRRAMLQISEGDLDAQIEGTSQDEIGELAASFRTMASKLKKSYQSLCETNDKLEDQTRELARSNEGLDRYSEELKGANSRLKKLDELKSNFMAAASHELKTPLTSIKGYLEMVLNGESGLLNSEQKEYLGYVKQSTDRLQRLLKELLDISQIESGRATLRRESADLKILIREELVLFQAQAQEKGTELSMENDPDLKSIFCDSDKIREVLDNLLSNAIKYTPPHGKIRVFSKNHEKGIQIGVRDNGIGIKKEEQGRIFEPFQHLDQMGADANQEESTGLGLTLVKKIVEAHGGQIHVESEENKGSTFTVILPLDMRRANLNELIGRDL